MGGTSHVQMYDAFGAYVRSQRRLAQLTLRQAAELASISNPYLSQIEHGLALPSITVIAALAKALSVSAETMLLRAAGVVSQQSAGGWSQSEDAIRQDSRLDERQKLALLAVLASFVGSSPDPASASTASASTASPDPASADPARVGRRRPSTPTTSARPPAAGAANTRRKGK